MNGNALVNPSSCGGYDWSQFLSIRPQILGNYDGFNYIGFGILLMIPFVFVFLLLVQKEKTKVREVLKNHIPLLIVCIVFTLFALSNVITFDEKVCFTYLLPEWLIDICGIFRASGRLFYPVYYLLILLLLFTLWHLRSILGGKRQCLLYLLFSYVCNYWICIM